MTSFNPTYEELQGLLEAAKGTYYGHTSKAKLRYEVESFTAEVLAKEEGKAPQITIFLTIP